MFIRELSFKLVLRLYDTYLSDDKFSVLLIYLCVAVILKFSKKLKKLNFNDIVILLQNLPTKDWTENDIDLLFSEAYVFMSTFE